MVIGIVGLGLIGGSFAKALKSRTAHHVLGLDRDKAVERRALEENMLDGRLDDASIAQCDLLLVALYPQAAIEFIKRQAERIKKGDCVVDLCGVKRPVCSEIHPLARENGFTFVGGHPMAGSERSGYAAAKADLFAGASMILTPQLDEAESVRKALEPFFLSIGFGCVHITDPAEHDHMIAYTSQLAHVLSSAYVQTPSALRHKGFSAGSFKDMTRVATLNEDMWTELFMLNRDHLADELEALCGRLAAYSSALRAQNDNALKSLLHKGCEYKAQITREEGRGNAEN